VEARLYCGAISSDDEVWARARLRLAFLRGSGSGCGRLPVLRVPRGRGAGRGWSRRGGALHGCDSRAESPWGKLLPRIDADERGSETASSRIQVLASKNRNMPRHSLVLKDYVFAPNFAQDFRYTKQALVYSGLLAARAAYVSGNADFLCETVSRWPKDRPQ
jgi:hypothetical protein